MKKFKGWGVYKWIEIITQDNRRESVETIYNLVNTKLTYISAIRGPYNSNYWNINKIKADIIQIKFFHPGKHIVSKLKEDLSLQEKFDVLLVELAKINNRKNRETMPLSRKFIAESIGCSEQKAWLLRSKAEQDGKITLNTPSKTTQRITKIDKVWKVGFKRANLYEFSKELLNKVVETIKVVAEAAVVVVKKTKEEIQKIIEDARERMREESRIYAEESAKEYRRLHPVGA